VFGEKKFNLVVTTIHPPLGDIKVLSAFHEEKESPRAKILRSEAGYEESL
jgi:hypothetical protein